MTETRVLQVEDLNVAFPAAGGWLQAVRHVDLRLARGETLGIVGESGCGKSTLLLALMGLLDPRRVRLTGDIRFCSEELLGAPAARLRQLRGNRLAMIFQDPMTSLNPYLRVGVQITEQIRRHTSVSRATARARAVELLGLVGLPEPAARLRQYAHELSGGMRQRVMIAMALSCSPDLLLADEATTALDVTIQAQILHLLRRELRQRRMSLAWVTHDLGIVAGICDRVAVMYAGQVVEEAEVVELFARPCHPYTQALLAAVPRLDAEAPATLAAIAGQPPNLVAPPPGCAFAPRCAYAQSRCREQAPRLHRDSSGRVHRCHFEPDGRRPSGAAAADGEAAAATTATDTPA